MAENLKCNNCDKPATVHLTQIVNNKIIKVDLCEACAQAKGVTDPEGVLTSRPSREDRSRSSAERWGTFLPRLRDGSARFRRTGRLGCATCFGLFAEQLVPVLEDMHVGLEP